MAAPENICVTHDVKEESEEMREDEASRVTDPQAEEIEPHESVKYLAPVSSDTESEDPLPFKRKSYDLQFKLEVAAYAEKHNKSKAAKDMKVPRSCVKDWTEQKPRLEAQLRTCSASSSKRLHGAGRPLLNKDFDEELLSWVHERRRAGLRVSRSLIQKEALALSRDASFKASNGWLEKFLHRHNLMSRRPAPPLKDPKDCAEEIVSYLMFVEQWRRTTAYAGIFAADETAVHLEDQTGKGHDKLCVNVMLTARSDGFKCQPYVLLKSKRPVKELASRFKNKLLLCWAGRTFFNDQLTSDYLQKVLGASTLGRCLLAWDSYRCHVSDATRQQLEMFRIDPAVIPPGCSRFIQAANVFWKGPFKATVQQFYSNWISEGEKSYTSSGHMRAPPAEAYLQWISDAWDLLPKDLVVRSFKGCGLSTALDGSEDYKIRCFQSDGLVPSGHQLLKQARARAIASIVNARSRLVEECGETDEDSYNSDVSLCFQWD